MELYGHQYFPNNSAINDTAFTNDSSTLFVTAWPRWLSGGTSADYGANYIRETQGGTTLSRSRDNAGPFYSGKP